MEKEKKKLDKNNHGVKAKYAFFYFLSLVALILTATSVGAIIFQLIDKFIPDGLNIAFNYGRSSVSWELSILIISAPVYFITNYKINKGLYEGELDNDSGIRRWLSYFILFVSSVTIIGYLISILFSFLEGELSTRFILQALTAIIISGEVFGYYLYDVKRENVLHTKNGIMMVWKAITLVFVFIVLVLTFVFLFENPAIVRQRRLDQQVSNRLDNVERSIERYYEINDKLPKDIDELLEGDNFLLKSGLENNEGLRDLEYKVLGNNKYELCATFNLETTEESNNENIYYDRGLAREHGAGKQCFGREIKKLIENGVVVVEPIDQE